MSSLGVCRPDGSDSHDFRLSEPTSFRFAAASSSHFQQEVLPGSFMALKLCECPGCQALAGHGCFGGNRCR